MLASGQYIYINIYIYIHTQQFLNNSNFRKKIGMLASGQYMPGLKFKFDWCHIHDEY